MSNGNIFFFDGRKIHKINCINRNLIKPNNYKCFQIEGKIIIAKFFIIIIKVFWNIVKKIDENESLITYFLKLGLKDNINLISSIIYQFPSISTKQFNYYEFPRIEEANFREKSISKYEIPQYIEEIPDGFSIFCTLYEASKVKQYIQLKDEEKEKLGLIENEDKNKDDDILKEPIPKTNFCHLCRREFDNYLLHIESSIHKKSISNNQMMINTAKDTFKRINIFWNNKNNNINSQEKIENNKLYSTSISSFSSAVSLFKFDETALKNINNCILEQDNLEIENKNDKENQSENINKSKKKRRIKNKNCFISPIKTEKLLINKFSSHLSSSQSSLNLFINKKRKDNNALKSENNNNFIIEEKEENRIDYFANLNEKKNKQLINGIKVFFE